MATNQIKKIYFCVSEDSEIGSGATPQDAYEYICQNTRTSLEECTFYEATEIRVELKQVCIVTEKGK